jgi:hypothetical protein
VGRKTSMAVLNTLVTDGKKFNKKILIKSSVNILPMLLKNKKRLISKNYITANDSKNAVWVKPS